MASMMKMETSSESRSLSEYMIGVLPCSHEGIDTAKIEGALNG